MIERYSSITLGLTLVELVSDLGRMLDISGFSLIGLERWFLGATFSMYFANTIDASHTVVPRLWEFGSWLSRKVVLHAMQALEHVSQAFVLYLALSL